MSKARKHFVAVLMVLAFVFAVFAAGGCGGGGPSSSGSSSSDSSSSESTESGDTSSDADSSEESTEAAAELTMDDVESIQAYTDATFYGTGLVQVDITYNDDVDVSGVTTDTYVLMDRGSLNPDFGQIPIESVEINGQVVTLNISDCHSYATEDNAEVYADGSGSRVRNALGIYCTGSWYRDVNGTIYYDEGDEDAGYEANTTGRGYQARHSLELKLRHSTEDDDAFACLADEDTGEFVEGGLWYETIDRQFADDLDTAISEGKFVSFANAGIQVESTAASVEGSGDDYVKGYIYVPEDYDPANGVVFTFQGLGISYWQLDDGTNNDGTGIMYDSATTSWAGKGAIVANIHDRSTAPDELSTAYDFVVDDANTMKYIIEKWNITGPVVIQGNSRGTWASDMMIKALLGFEYSYDPSSQGTWDYTGEAEGYVTGQLDADEYYPVNVYICQNGDFIGDKCSEEELDAIADSGLKVWMFVGEQDSNSYSTFSDYKTLMEEKMGEDWAEENVRITGYATELFYPWGESDHSVTRINGWYFCDEPYYGENFTTDEETGEIEYTTKLEAGTEYSFDEAYSTGSNNASKGYVFEIYTDKSFQEWALETDEE